jgi:hypothetical protein
MTRRQRRLMTIPIQSRFYLRRNHGFSSLRRPKCHHPPAFLYEGIGRALQVWGCQTSASICLEDRVAGFVSFVCALRHNWDVGILDAHPLACTRGDRTGNTVVVVFVTFTHVDIMHVDYIHICRYNQRRYNSHM